MTVAERRLATIENYWRQIETLRGHLDIADFKHRVLGLLFLRGLSLSADLADEPASLAWIRIHRALHTGNLSAAINLGLQETAARIGISSLGDYQRDVLDSRSLCALVLLIHEMGMASEPASEFVIETFRFFLQNYAKAEGRLGSDFCTPKSLIKLLVKVASPSGGSIYDPCCGAGGLLVESGVRMQQIQHSDWPFSLYGQESNPATWRLCKMNTALSGLSAAIGVQHADTFQNDLHPTMKADCVIANPPFNVENWNARASSARSWTFGAPPANSSNFAWIQHIIGHLAPQGTAVFTMSNGALFSNNCGEGDIRQRIIEADLVDCIVALPSHLFPTTRIPACIWILAQDKSGAEFNGQRSRNRRDQILFIDAQRMGRMTDRVRRVLDDSEIDQIATTYGKWRGRSADAYVDTPGFSASCHTSVVAKNDYVLTPGRYVNVEQSDEFKEDPASKIESLTKQLNEQFKESVRLEHLIRERLEMFYI